MKYAISINQAGIVAAGLADRTDLTDWAIIDYLKDWFFAEDKKTFISEGKQFTWVNYRHLMESMPLVGIKDKDALSLRFKKLRGLGLIETIQLKDNSLYFRLTELCIETCFMRLSTKQDEHPTPSPGKQGAVPSREDSLSHDDRTACPMAIGQGLSHDDRTAQIDNQSIVNQYKVSPAQTSVCAAEAEGEHLDAAKPKRSPLQLKYDQCLQAYERIRGIKLEGKEYNLIRRELKLMFDSNRTPDQIIKFMEWCEQQEGVWKSWTIFTIRKHIADFLAGRLDKPKAPTRGEVNMKKEDIEAWEAFLKKK